jgi:hypothetical protein
MLYFYLFQGQNKLPLLVHFGIRGRTRQVKEFSTCSVNSALRHRPSARCASAANDVCKFLDIFSKNNISFEDTFSIRQNVYINCMYRHIPKLQEHPFLAVHECLFCIFAATVHIKRQFLHLILEVRPAIVTWNNWKVSLSS